MGQEQSSVDPTAVPGFNPEKPVRLGGRVRRKAAPKRTAKVKPEVEEYFAHETVTDHITPIFADESKTKKGGREAGDLNEEIDVTALLQSLGRQVKEEEEDDDGNLADFPEYSAAGSSSEESDADGDTRGVYHHEVEYQEGDTNDIKNPRTHPVSIKGDICVGSVLMAVDQSPWLSQFPIGAFEWFTAMEVSTQSRFGLHPESSLPSFKLPSSAVGRFIQLKCSRRVEDQLHDTRIHETEGGVFDAHVGSKPKHVDRGTERKFYKVESTAIAGPVLISDEMAYTISTYLAHGSLGVAVKLRDEQMSQADDDSGARNKLTKLPAYLKMSYESVEFQYEQPKRNTNTKSSLFNSDWMSTLKKHSDSAEGSSPSPSEDLSGPVRAKWPLSSIQFRPSKSKNTLILATELTKIGFSHKRSTQGLMRFDVDPSVGRDTVLYASIAFQGAVAHGKARKSRWAEDVEEGRLDNCKYLVQSQLEEIATKADETAPAFEEMPVTPWDH